MLTIRKMNVIIAPAASCAGRPDREGGSEWRERREGREGRDGGRRGKGGEGRDEMEVGREKRRERRLNVQRKRLNY